MEIHRDKRHEFEQAEGRGPSFCKHCEQPRGNMIHAARRRKPADLESLQRRYADAVDVLEGVETDLVRAQNRWAKARKLERRLRKELDRLTLDK